MFLPEHLCVSSPLLGGGSTAPLRGFPQPGTCVWSEVRAHGQQRGRHKVRVRLLTHTPGTALLRLQDRLGAVDRWTAELVTIHMGSLKGTQGSALVARNYCLPLAQVLS